MIDGLKANHRAAIIATLAANHRVERAVLFGSRAMGANTITSDVDIALFGQHLTLTDQANLAAACEELPMAQSVDLVLHSTIDNSALVEHIRSYGVEWYRRGGGDGAKVAESDGNAPTRQKINEVPVSEVATVVIGGTPNREINEYWNGIIPWATAKDIANAGSRHLHNTQDFITDIGLANSSTKVMPKDTVIITPRGTVGALVQLGKEMAFNQTCYAVLPGTGIDNDFLYYALIGTRHSLKSLTYGTIFQTITTKSFDSWRIPLPPLKQQKAVAHVLGTLDDKIELNRRMNETLEAMARALFKDWFVDFGPVRAKAEGREAYLPEEIWGLFPDSFEDSELGEIPRGWGVKSLSEIATFLNGLALQKYPATSPEDSLPVIKIAELRNGVSTKTDKASRNIPKKYIVTDGDFLFSWSGSLMAEFWTEGEGALNQHLFKVTSDQYPPWFFAGWVRFHLDGFQRIAASKATTMGHIQRSHLQAALASCPPDAAVAGLSAVIEPLVRRGVSARVESRSLAKIRDRLLPNLMSGGIRVREGEKVMEVAA